MSNSDTDIDAVWKKGSAENNNDPNTFRKDSCGAWIRRDQYGIRDTKYGWEIDHIKPLSKGGLDVLSNKQPLHWKNNASKQDGRNDCPVTSNGTTNVGL